MHEISHEISHKMLLLYVHFVVKQIELQALTLKLSRVQCQCVSSVNVLSVCDIGIEQYYTFWSAINIADRHGISY